MADKKGFTLDTPEKKAKFLLIFSRKKTNVAEACRAMGISRRTFYDWYNDDENFKAAVEEAREAIIDWAEGKLRTRINKGSDAAVIFFLKTQGKKRGYVEKQSVEHSGQVDSKLVVEVVDTK
jgi:AcrR family transcriptional regulator